MKAERLVERLLFASRWLLCPIYLGLAVLLIVLMVNFFRQLVLLGLNALQLSEVDVILGALTLVDITLIAGLIVMVMLSGYENFVSRLDLAEAERSIAWLGKLDTGGLKLKVSAAIVAISAIQLLKMFMEAATVPNDKLVLMVIIHLTFVVSALLLTVMDRMSASDAKHER